MAVLCKNCGNKVSTFSGTTSKCYGCFIEICDKCSNKGINIWLCGSCFQNLQQRKHLRDIFYCPKCRRFGKIQFDECNYCGNNICLGCLIRTNCIGNHTWCGMCPSYNIRQIEIPYIQRITQFKGNYGGYYPPGPYSWGRSRKWGRQVVNICSLDSQNIFDELIKSMFTGRYCEVTEPHLETESYEEFIKKANPNILIEMKNASSQAGFSWHTTLYSCLPLIYNVWHDHDDIVSIFSKIDDAELITFISDFYGSQIGQENIGRYSIKIWESLVLNLSLDFLRKQPGYAALYVWVGSKYLMDLHAGLRAIKMIGLQTSFFTGMSQIIQGLIEMEGRLCIEGLKNIRRDKFIPSDITNKVITNIEANMENLQKVIRDGEKLKIEQFIDQRGAIVGDYVEEKMTKKTEVRDSVVMRSTIGDSEQTNFKVCPYCGKELNIPKTPKFCPYCKEQLR